MNMDLLSKYDVPVPRYTSYPTVPLWDTAEVSTQKWVEHLKMSFSRNREISLYIHLPYCEALCTYCGCNKYITKNHLVERPYVDAVLKEWKMYLFQLKEKPLIREIHLGGGTPTFFSAEHLKLLVNGLLQGAEVANDYSFSFEAHPSSTSSEHLKVLRSLGFDRISVGVQDFDQEIMKVIHRFQTTEQIRSLTSEARSLGYTSVNYDLIYGLPRQTPEHISKNLKYLAELKPDRIAFYSYAHVPDVKKAQRAYSEEDLPKGMDKLNLYNQGKTGLEALGYKNIGMDHFALPSDELYISMKNKELHRNFMGYTPHHTNLCIALGVSGISDSWTAYAQNEKTVKDYLIRINKENELPISKTHFLTEEDLVIRKQILDLICCYQLDCQRNKHSFSDKLREVFTEMEADGLVNVFPDQVKVTEQGKNFIRNICRALDARMDRHQEKLTFSRAI